MQPLDYPEPAQIIVNCWFIKNSNGLFHYALDYAEALGPRVREVLVRSDQLAELVRRRLPLMTVRTVNLPRLLAIVAGCRGGRGLIFTPSAHPLPVPIRQVVVLHDRYPFMGPKNRLKRGLFVLAAKLSAARLGYVNRSDARAFLEECGFTGERMVFLPNALPQVEVLTTDTAEVEDRIMYKTVVGLFGTDSPKKNYEAFLEQLSVAQTTDRPRVLIYGHENSYVEGLRKRFGREAFELVHSDKRSLPRFIADLDLVVSIARGEGFARPIALALLARKRAFLLDTPVFREFYEESASIFGSEHELVAAIVANGGQAARRTSGGFAKESELREDFARAVEWLARL